MTLSPQAVCLNGRTKSRSMSEPGANCAAAVAAGGDHGQPFGLRRVLRVVEMLGGEIVENLDQRVLHIGQRARRDEACERAVFDPRLDARPRRLRRRLDVLERRLAEFAAVAFGARQRRQVAPERVAVEQA